MSSQRKVNQLTCLNFAEMLFTSSQNEDRGPDFEERTGGQINQIAHFYNKQ